MKRHAPIQSAAKHEKKEAQNHFNKSKNDSRQNLVSDICMTLLAGVAGAGLIIAAFEFVEVML